MDVAHVLVTASLTRESLYVAMSRGREANTAHVVTGPAPVKGEPMAQAEPMAVMAEVLERTSSSITATEAMREAQAFATNTAHLLTMYTAATRGPAYQAIDQAVRERVSPAQYARYAAEPQRPVFQRLVLAATLAGEDLGEVVDQATAKDFTGARSVSAVMHGRLEAAGAGRAARGQSVTWAERVPEVGRPAVRALGQRLADAMDARATELAHAQAARPQPWVLSTLGAYPADGSDALKADWLARVGSAASYREAAGINDPTVPAGAPPEGHPELLEAHGRTLAALEIRSEVAAVIGSTAAELEERVAAYQRVRATAPPMVEAELKAQRTAEASARARAVDLAHQGQAEAAGAWFTTSARANASATELEEAAQRYAAWEAGHQAERAAAEAAQAELDRRAKLDADAQAELEREAEKLAHAHAAGQPAGTQHPQVPGPEPEPEPEAAAVSPAGEPQVSTGAEAEAEDVSVPHPDPQLAQAVAGYDAHQARRQAEAEARAGQLAEREEELAVREASSSAAQAELDTPEAQASAWVPGPQTPAWGGPAAVQRAPGRGRGPAGRAVTQSTPSVRRHLP